MLCFYSLPRRLVSIMGSNGWIKLHRDLKYKAIFHNEKLLKVFIWCLLKATHEDYQQLIGRQIICLTPGQFVTGRHKASEELRLKPSTAWDYLKVLESNNTINIVSNNKYSIISIVNWGLYQLGESNLDNRSNRIPNTKTTAFQHKQEHKNKKKKEEYTEHFELFYRIYPNSKGKAQTFQNWMKLVELCDPETIIQCAENYKSTLNIGAKKEFITTSYNFIGQKAVYEDYLPLNNQKLEPKLTKINEIIYLTEDEQEIIVRKMEIERQSKIEVRTANYGG